MIGLFLGIIFGAVIAFVVPSVIPPNFRSAAVNWALRVVGVVIVVLSIASTSYVYVPGGRYAQLEKIYLGSPLAADKIIAINGEKGKQAEILPPGFHFRPLINVIFSVDTSKAETTIPAGQVGVLTAMTGEDLRQGQTFADPFPADVGYKMLDTETFLRSHGQRGAQLSVLTPGTYRLNDFLWKVQIVDAREVKAGFVGVVTSNVHADVDFGTMQAKKPDKCEAMTAGEISANKLDAPVVPVGCIGVWKQALQPGLYFYNPAAFKLTDVDTRAQVWTYAGGYDRCGIALKVDSKGEITQERSCNKVPIDKDNADSAVFVKMEGWDVPLELRVVAQIAPTDASCIVAGVGTLKEVEDRVLTPSIRAITRDVAGGTYEVTEPKLSETGAPILVNDKPVMLKVNRPTKVLDLITQRPLLEGEIESRIRPEGQKSCVTIREVRLGEPAIPPELLVAVRREQLATQLAKAYIQEQAAQSKRIDSEKAKATADQQSVLVTAEIEVKRTEQTRVARENEGKGERAKLEQIAEGQKAQQGVLGIEATVNLRKYELMLDRTFGFMEKNPDVVKAALENATKFVPNVQVGASGDSGIGSLITGLLAQQLDGGRKDAQSPRVPGSMEASKR